MPPDYPKKDEEESEKGDEELKPRLDALEGKLYSSQKALGEGRAFEGIKKTDRGVLMDSVRRSWAEQKDAELSGRAEPVKTRNTYQLLKQVLVGSLVLFFASLGVAGYVLLGGKNIVSSENVVVLVNMPVSAGGGEKIPFEISITNQNNVPLVSADILVEYPDGSREVDNLSKELRRRLESIGRVEVGENINRKLESVFFGEQGEVKTIKVSLEYRVEGSNAIFSKSETKTLTLSSAPVSVVIESAKEASVGDEIVFTVGITANSSQIIEDLMLLADYPFGFNYLGSDLGPVYANNVWDLGDMKPGSFRQVKIKGSFSGREGEERAVRFSVGSKDIRDSRKIGVVFLTKTHSVLLAKPFIVAELLFDGAVSSEHVADPGRSVRGDVVIKNNTESKISNVIVEVKLNGSIFDRNSVSSGNGFFRSVDNTIVFNQITEKELSVIEPGENVDLSFNFDILSSASKLKSPQMNVEVSVTGNRQGAGPTNENVKISTSGLIKVSSAMSVSAKALYSSGPFINYGPIPPKIEEETSYTIILSVDNSTNDLSDVEVKTGLPVYVKWLGNISPQSEKLKYNEIGGGITWEVGDLKVGDGPKEVYFQVSFSPSLTQNGTFPILINGVSASGYDRFSSRSLEAEFREYVDISLPFDSIYKSKGGPVKK